MWGRCLTSVRLCAPPPREGEKRAFGRQAAVDSWTCSEIEAHDGSGKGTPFAGVDLLGVILSH